MNKRKSPSANLENKRKIFLEIGFILTLAAVLAALEWKTYDHFNFGQAYESSYKGEEMLTPILLKKVKPVPKKPKSFMVINTIPDNEDADEIEINADIDEDDPIEDWTPPIEEEIAVDEVVPYFKVEIKPEFPGGETAMMRFVAEHYKVPRLALEQGVSGTIHMGFTINANGKVCNIIVVRGISPECDEEAIRVISLMPQWKPGKQLTHNVPVDFHLPIKISLR